MTIYVIMFGFGGRSSLHLIGVGFHRCGARFEAAGAAESEAEGVREDSLSWIWFRDVAEADGFFNAIRGPCRQQDVAAFDLRDLCGGGGVAQAGAVHPTGERFPERIARMIPFASDRRGVLTAPVVPRRGMLSVPNLTACSGRCPFRDVDDRSR
jgi:hypothetical protein